EQVRREIDPDLAAAIVAGAYWLREPGPGAELAIAYCGAVAPEALAAYEAIAEDIPQAGLLAITSPDRVHRDWRTARARGETGVAERLLAPPFRSACRLSRRRRSFGIACVAISTASSSSSASSHTSCSGGAISS